MPARAKARAGILLLRIFPGNYKSDFAFVIVIIKTTIFFLMASYVISDIHGCLKTFRQLVENGIALRKKDKLYLLGDYVNKGPDSKGVLDYIMGLIEAGYQVNCLRGNHDQLLLDAVDIGNGAIWLPKSDQKRTLANFGVSAFTNIENKYLSFIRSMLLYLKSDSFILVHAGLDFTYPEAALFNDPYTLLNIKEFKADKEKLGGKTLIHGHTPVSKEQILESITAESIVVNLDGGCAYYKNTALGNLVALNLSTRTLQFQSNIDKPYYIKIKQ